MYQASVSTRSNCNALLVGVLLASANLLAQTDQGQIAGTVRDSSDAVVPSATVTAVSAQGARHSALTGENGSYILTNLPVGFYELRVEAPGFKAFVTSNVKVDVAARRTVDFQLEVGAVTESVVVTASAVQMQMETAQIGRTVESKQITDLALNGRNPINLTLLKAGVVGGNFNNFNPNNLHESFAVNGGRRNGNNVTVDGVNAVRTRGDFTSSAQVGLFNVDTIQEVQILTSTYPAEYGRAMDGQIRFVTKGGSREFHGSAWHFLRNSALDANSWTRNQSPNPNDSRRAAPFRFNQPGYTIGGPIVLPGLGNQNRDKLFFFASQEWLMWRRERTVTNTVPSLRMREGDFSELLDPNNPFFRRTRVITDSLNGGSPFPNNVIPPSRLSSNGVAILRAYPEPTAGFLQGTANWIKTLPNPRDSRKDTFRIDYMPGKHRVNLVGNLYSHTEDDPFVSDLDRSNSRWDRPNQTGSIGITTTWTPTVITDFNFSAANDVVYIGIYDNEGESRYRRGQYGLNFPYIVPGSKRIDDRIPRAVLANFATLDGSSRPVSSSGPMYNLTGNLTLVTNSAHTVKFGGWISHDQQNNNDQSGAQQNGEFSFVDTGHPLTSGLAVANAALGYFDQYTEQGTAAYTLLRSNSFEAYVQDTWRASRNLTLEMGVRYAYHQPWYAKWNDIANFDARFYDPAQRAVIDPIGGFIVSGDPYNGVVLPGDGFPESARGRANGQSLPGVDRLFHGLPRGFVNSYKNAFAPRLGVAYRIGDKTVIRAGGGVFHHRQMHNQGSLFRNAPNQIQVQVQNGVVDQPGGATRRDFPFFIRAIDLNAKYPTAYSYSFSLQQQVPGSIVVELAYVGKTGVNQERTRNINQLLPGTANRGINAAALRPYYGLGQIDLTERNGRTNYDSLQVSVDRRFASGLGFGLSYSFSKTLSDINTPFNSNQYVRALDDQDRPHVLNVNYIYELPLFRGQRGWKGNALGGWQISGVTFFRSGSVFSVTDGVDVAGVGPGAAQTWDVVGGQSLYVSGETGVGLPWFNKAAFARPQTGTFGNAGYNTIRGPQFVNWDAALFKKFAMTERVRSEFRFEVFNFPNHPLLGNPIVAPQSGTFGQITSKTGERNVQLGFKVAF